MTGGQALAAALKAENIEHVFGIVGTHNTPMFDGIYGDDDLKVITVRHEQGATLMAAGYARASGRIAASIVVPGPGLTNALTGMGMAYAESAPMLVVGGQNALNQLDREGGYFHELRDSMNVAGSVSGFAARASAPSGRRSSTSPRSRSGSFPVGAGPSACHGWWDAAARWRSSSAAS